MYRLSEATQCAAVAIARAEYGQVKTHRAEVWNSLSLADQNTIRRDLHLAPLKRRSTLREVYNG